jgi:cytoskeletal protein RodZ
MKYTKIKTKTKKVIIITLLSLACVAGLISAFAYFKLNKPDPKQVQQQAEQQESTEAKKTTGTEAANTQSGDQEQVDKSSNTNAAGGDTSKNTTPTNTTVSIDSAIQESNVVNVVASVTGISSGSCQFKFSAPDGSSLSKNGDVVGGKCKLATSALEFGFIGEWSVVVSVGDVSSSTRGVNIQ